MVLLLSVGIYLPAQTFSARRQIRNEAEIVNYKTHDAHLFTFST